MQYNFIYRKIRWSAQTFKRITKNTTDKSGSRHRRAWIGCGHGHTGRPPLETHFSFGSKGRNGKDLRDKN